MSLDDPPSRTVKHGSSELQARYTVDAAAKALALLNSFSFQERSLSLSRLASRTGIPRATAFRLLSTLEQAGFLTKVGFEYRLGIKCLVLGSLVDADMDVRQAARPHLIALQTATRETTHLAVLHQWQVVYLDRIASPQPVGFMRSRPGAVLPAYCTALGKTLLAHQPEEDVVAWAVAAAFEAFTTHTVTSAAQLLDELHRTRARGYSIDDQEHEDGVRCIAAPIRNHIGEVVAAISVAGPAYRMPHEMEGCAIAEQVCASARAISRELGAIGEAGCIADFGAVGAAHGGRR